MKKNIKRIVLFSFTMLQFAFFTYGREVGKLINGVPVVTLSSVDLMNQLSPFGNCGVSNITFTEMHLTYTSGSPGGGYFIYTINFTDTLNNEVNKLIVSVECVLNPSNNIFEGKANGTGWACVSQNCSDCCPVDNDCTVCNTTDPEKNSSCGRVNSEKPWGNCLDAVLVDVKTWLIN
jgi:hypothetical protein